MFRRGTRLRAPAVLIAALAALAVFAATAAADTRTGEATSPVDPAIPAEADVVKATASYDTTAGTVGITVTTAAEPQAENGGGASPLEAEAVLVDAPGPCELSVVDAALESGTLPPPLMGITAPYSMETAETELIGTSTEFFPTAKSVSGATTSLSVTAAQLTNLGLDCAFVGTTEVVEGVSEDVASPLALPLSVPSGPPVPPAPPAPTPPAPGPPVLSIGKTKPSKLKVGKSKTVKIKLTNTGATATGVGSLRVKAPAGVIVKPGKQRVPVLLPGGSWTLSVRVQLTAKAKKSSTISLTGTASGVTAKSSFVVRLTR
jgi:hypothetical protein